MKQLNDVCLITIDGRKKEADQKNYNLLNNIINFCNTDIKFKYSVHLTSSIDNDIEYIEKNNTTISSIKIPELSYFQYNIFCVNYLYGYISKIPCSHFLIIQDDGFIINPNLWDDDFLNYDYIGAPWIKNENEEPFGWVAEYGNSIGNGGFSLRSKKFIKESSCLNYNSTANEDVFLTCVKFNYFKGKNINFPNIDLAARFSIETRTNKYNNFNNCFGFHGKHNLNDVKKLLNEKGITNVLQ